MSEENAEVDTSSFCASCGIAEVDDIKLKECDACDLVRYCSDECQRDHASRHKEACRKRAHELRVELLFKQPESSHIGDCPICCLPLPLVDSTTTLNTCCSKLICNGCRYANHKREIEARLKHTCLFCRKALPYTEEECKKYRMERVKTNDPVAMTFQGMEQYSKGDFISAFQYWTKASKLGDMDAHYQLAYLYAKGQGVEKDRRKEMYHLEEAAIGGHPRARYSLGSHKWNNGSIEKAVKHWIIAASQGYDHAIKPLMKAYREAFLEKDDLTATLRAYQAAVDATKSPQREAYTLWDAAYEGDQRMKSV